MPDISPNLALPYLMPSQAQKHVTHNEALARLDLVVQLAVAQFGAEIPPASPQPGEIHAIGPAPQGDWTGQAGRLAAWDGTAWGFIAPREGWLAWGRAESALRLWQGSGWEALSLGQLAQLGIGTVADATNRLAVAAPATLLTHAGAGHQVKINKAAPGDTASLLLQDNWSGRAEIGLTGSDDFAIKVSADGTSFQTALRFDCATGLASGQAVTQGAADATAGRLLKAGDFGLGGTAVPLANGVNLATAGLAGGRYSFVGSGVTGGPEVQAYRYLLEAGFGPDGRRHFLCWRDASSNPAACLWVGHQASNGSGAIGWHRLLTPSNLLGTVSQAAGVPTGAVIERGSNANGEYVRFADGTQICCRSVSHDLSSAAFQYWTYAAGFAAIPVAMAGPSGVYSAQIAGWYARQGSAWGNSTSQWASRASVGAAAADTISLQLTAIGRWF